MDSDILIQVVRMKNDSILTTKICEVCEKPFADSEYTEFCMSCAKNGDWEVECFGCGKFFHTDDLYYDKEQQGYLCYECE